MNCSLQASTSNLRQNYLLPCFCVWYIPLFCLELTIVCPEICNKTFTKMQGNEFRLVHVRSERQTKQDKECWVTAASWHQCSHDSVRRVFHVNITTSFAWKQDEISVGFFKVKDKVRNSKILEWTPRIFATLIHVSDYNWITMKSHIKSDHINE